MFDRDTMREHLRYMDTATDNELAVRLSLYQKALEVLPMEADSRKDLETLMRKLKEEQAARICLQQQRR